MKVYSKRKRKAEPEYSYDLPQLVRSRILHTLDHQVQHQRVTSFQSVLKEVSEILLREFGGLVENTRAFIRTSDASSAAAEHFFHCSDEAALDFIEICFWTRHYCGGQPAVDAMNDLFEDENIGFELTSFERIDVTPGGPYGGGTYQVIRPVIIEKNDKLIHAEAVQPCLQVLAGPKWTTARAELISAFQEQRAGEYGDAITDAGAAFETVLKTICTRKKWAYDKDKDTLAKLLEACRAKDLYHPFYKQVLEGVATIRNKVGDAHGKGPNPEFVATKELAEHMLHTVCTNINLVVALAE